MRILQINNFHYIRGGAERSYLELCGLLKSRGHKVACFSTKDIKNHPSRWDKYFVKSYDLDKNYNPFLALKIIQNIFYNFASKKSLQNLIQDFKPSVAHLHNIYHHLSPSIISVLKKNNIPMVMTLRDYKLISPNYSLFSRGQIWEKTKNQKYYKCFFDKSIKNSYLKSLICTLEAYLHQWLKLYQKIDIFISPSMFLANKFKDFGFKKQIINLPNPLLETPSPTSNNIKDFILYFGRLSPEKGIPNLINAYSKLKTKTPLLIAGSGASRKELETLAKKNKNHSQIIFLGHKNKKELSCLIKSAKFLVFPSVWPENAPRSVIESMAFKKIVICAKVGGIPEWVKHGQTGFLYPPGDVKKLAEIMSNLLNSKYNDKELQKISSLAQKTVIQKNNPEKFYNSLINIYASLISDKN
ncbi:glycosyltransferase [Candidatus Falkowbacteria bacterium]|nr:glycosyltransferase [Candidatus Falkowbacteria bacterium]